MPADFKKVLVVGALGRMGERVRAVLEDHPTLRLGAAIEAPGHAGIGADAGSGVKVADNFDSALAASDVVIDFSIPPSTLDHLRAALQP